MAKQHTFKYLRSTNEGIIQKTETRDLTRSQAIKFLCLDCAGGIPAEVRGCHISTCPLYVYRPFKR